MREENYTSLEPEQAVFSIILNNPDAIYSIEGLNSYMFSTTTHVNLYLLLQDIKEQHLIADLGMVLNFARNLNRLDVIGGEKYLVSIKERTYPKENLSEFVRTVKNAYKYNRVLEIGTALRSDQIKVGTIDETISQINSKLDKLLTDSGGEGTYSIGSLIKTSFNEIVDRVNNPGIRGLTTGFKKIDALTGGFDGGDLWYIGARPGMGKSSLISCSAITEAHQNVPTLIFSKEMTRQPLMERFLSLETGLSLFDIRGGFLKKPEVEILREASRKMAEYPLYIDLNFTSSMEQIEATTRKYLSLYGTKIIYIDYIQLLSERDENQTQELGKISRKLKLLANQLDITFVVLSQLSRDIEHRDNKRPITADLRQCGNLEEDADFVIGLYRDEVYNKETKDRGKIEYIILKHRNGPVGTIRLGFEENTARVKED